MSTTTRKARYTVLDENGKDVEFTTAYDAALEAERTGNQPCRWTKDSTGCFSVPNVMTRTECKEIIAKHS